MKTFKKLLAVTMAASLALQPVFAGNAFASIEGLLASYGGSIPPSSGGGESTGSESGSTQGTGGRTFTSPYSSDYVKQLIADYKSEHSFTPVSFTPASYTPMSFSSSPLAERFTPAAISTTPLSTRFGTDPLTNFGTTGIDTTNLLSRFNTASFPTTSFGTTNLLSNYNASSFDTTNLLSRFTSNNFASTKLLNTAGSQTPSLTLTSQQTPRIALNTVNTNNLATVNVAASQYRQASWATATVFTNTFDLNNDLKVDSNDIAQMKDLNGDTAIDAKDTALFNNIINFDTISAAQQIMTVQQLAPAYSAALIGTLVSQEQTAAAVTIYDNISAQKAVAIGNELAKTENGQAAAAEILATMAGTMSMRDRAASIINSMAPASAASVLARMPTTASITIVKNDNTTNAGAILKELSKLQGGAKIAAAILTNMAGSVQYIDRASSILNDMEASAAANIVREMDKSAAAAIIRNGNMTVASAAKIFNELAKTSSDNTGINIISALLNVKQTAAQSLTNAKMASIFSAMEPAAAAGYLMACEGLRSVVNIPAVILGNGKMSTEQAIKIVNEMANTAAGASLAASTLMEVYSNAPTQAKATAILKGLSSSAQTAVKQALGTANTNKILGTTSTATTTSTTNQASTTTSTTTTSTTAATTAGTTYTLSQIAGKTILPGTIIDDGTNKYVATQQFAAGANGSIPETIRFNKVGGLTGEHFIYSGGAFTQVTFVNGSSYTAADGTKYTALSSFTLDGGKLPKDALLKDSSGKVYKTDAAGAIGSAVTVYAATGAAGTKIAAGSVVLVDGKYYVTTKEVTYTSAGKLPVGEAYKNGWVNYMMDPRGAMRAAGYNDTTEVIKDMQTEATLQKCRAADETFPDGGITIFWTNEEAIPVQDLNLYVPGWDLRMLITADFDNDGDVETQDWDMDPAMVNTLGRSIDLDMPAELDGKTVTVAFYVVDAKGNPLITTTDAQTGKTTWAFGTAKDTAYVFGAGVPNLPGTAITFTVDRDPSKGEQLPQVTGYKVSGGNLTLQFASEFHPSSFTAFYVVVNGKYTQISDFKYFLSDDLRTMTIPVSAFGISIGSGDKVQIVAKEWTAGMTLLQTVIPGKTTPTTPTTPTSIKVGDSVTIGNKNYVAKTAFTYNTDGTIPANVVLNDAQGRQFTTTATGMDQNSYLAGDPIKINNVDYTVTTAFFYNAQGKIPQGTKFTGADNKIYVADATGSLKLETSSQPVQVNVGDPTVFDGKTYYFQSAFTSTGKIPNGIQLKDDEGRLFTVTADGLQQNSFLVGDPIKINNVDYTVTTAFFYNAQGKIPQGTKFTGADNKIYVADATGALKLQTNPTNQTVTLTDGTVLTATTNYTPAANGQIPAGVEFTDQKGHTFISTSNGSFRQIGFKAGDTIELTDGTILAALQDYTVTGDNMPANVKFTDTQGHTFITTTDGMFRQIGFKAGDTLELTDGTILTALQDYTVTGDDMPSNIKFKDAAGRQYITTDDGFRQLSYKAGDQIELVGGTKLTSSSDFTVTSTGDFPAGIEFTDSQNQKWVTTEDGSFRKVI